MNLYDSIREYIARQIGIEKGVITSLIILLGILIIAWIADWIVKKLIRGAVKRYVEKSRNKYDDVFYERRVFSRLAHLVPAIIVYFLVETAFPYNKGVVLVIKDIASIYMIWVVARVIVAFLNAINEIYERNPKHQGRSIKSYVQATIIIIYSIVVIIALSVLLNKDLSSLLAGLGAMTAVILLIFKDSILGLVAGTQLSANDMIRVGDWIVVPGQNADGVVEEITLNIVKVRNWDKTVSSVPTYALMTNSFVNWRGMEESGVRRIKRSVNIDMKSIKFVDENLYDKLSKVYLIKDYLKNKKNEIDEYNQKLQIDTTVPVNGRRMTNVGVFRKYLEYYLRNNENIHSDLTFLVRHLQPTEKGLPIEIYVFSKIQEWGKYEQLQADIFDHILAIIPYFDLRIFQEPAGHDIIEAITKSKAI